MSFFSIIILAFALSIDACIVSFSYGLAFEKERFRNAAALSIFTGLFQGLMPCIGYFLTGFVKSYIEPFSEWIIFVIFTYLGMKFIIEAYKNKKEKPLCINLKCLFLIGIATSIDAFSAGISLSLMRNHIFKPALLIAFVTFVNSNFGFFAGSKMRRFPTKMLEIIAGVILIILGIKALV